MLRILCKRAEEHMCAATVRYIAKPFSKLESTEERVLQVDQKIMNNSVMISLQQ
jgi:hypothetical protein